MKTYGEFLNDISTWRLEWSLSLVMEVCRLRDRCEEQDSIHGCL